MRRSSPLDRPRVDVVATAKVDLKEGDFIDGLGGYKTYGQAENYAVARAGAAPDWFGRGVPGRTGCGARTRCAPIEMWGSRQAGFATAFAPNKTLDSLLLRGKAHCGEFTARAPLPIL